MGIVGIPLCFSPVSIWVPFWTNGLRRWTAVLTRQRDEWHYSVYTISIYRGPYATESVHGQYHVTCSSIVPHTHTLLTAVDVFALQLVWGTCNKDYIALRTNSVRPRVCDRAFPVAGPRDVWNALPLLRLHFSLSAIASENLSLQTLLQQMFIIHVPRESEKTSHPTLTSPNIDRFFKFLSPSNSEVNV